MSFENDITEIKTILEDGQPIFKAASPEQIANRPDNWEDRIEEIDVLRSMFEENIGHNVLDSQWVTIIRQLLKDNNKKFGELEDFNGEILGFLIALDDACLQSGLKIK